MDQKDFSSGIEASAKSLEKWGKRMMATGAIITGAFAAPIIAGSKAAWDQVAAVEQATIAMNAYADSSEQVDAVLGQLLDYARSDLGVLFSRQELFSAAQSMLMYGASIEHVADYTEILSRSVGLGLSNWDDLNRVIGRVGSTGRLTGNDFDYLKAAGFDLDDSLRNTNITWEELMAHLDAGIPADALAGQADTIRGKTIRLQSALRGLGLAFLGVDADTSKFIEGGLGDTMVKGMSQLTELMKQAAPAVQQFGTWLGDIARRASSLVDVFIALPQPLKTGLLLFTGISGVALTLGGAFALVSAKVLGFLKVVSGLGGLTGIVKGFGVALRAVTLTNPLFWALAAAVAAVVAYRNNFMGFRSAVNRFASEARRYMRQVADVFRTVADVVKYFGRVWTSAFSAFLGAGHDPVSAGLMAVRQALYQVSVVAGPFGPLLRGIGDAFSAVRHVVDDAKESFGSFQSAASSLGDAIGFLLDGEWGKAFISLKDAATDGLEGVLTALDSVLDAFGQLGGWMIDRIGNLGSRLWSWFVGQLQSVDWAGAFSASLNALSSAGQWIVDKLGSAVTAIQGWFSTQFDGVDFASVAMDGAQRLGTAIGEAVATMVGIAADFLNWLTSQISSVDWNSVGASVGTFLGNAIKAGIGAIVLAGTVLVHFLKEMAAVDWASVAQSIWGFVKAAAIASIGFLAGMGKALYDQFIGEINGLDWLTSLQQKGRDIINGFYEAVTTRWVAVRTWFINLPTMVFNAIGNVLGTLSSRGTDILTGFFTAVVHRWGFGGVKDWFVGLGAMVLRAIGDLSSALWSAGVDLMQGFIGGVQSMAQSLINAAIQPVQDAINGVKGLLGINSPSRVFMEIGHNTMLGLANGIDRYSGLPVSSAQGVARGVADVDFVARAGASTVANNQALDRAHADSGRVQQFFFALTSEEFKDLQRKAESGDTFARGFAGQLNMSEGVA